MTFANPQYFYLLLLLIPLLLLLLYGQWKRRANERRYADVSLLKALKPDTSTLHRIIRNFLNLVVLVLLIISLARPQLILKKDVPSDQKGIECVMLLDISNSMLATDLKPNRLGFAKLSIQQIIDRIGPSKVGLVVFAGNAYTHLPITTDLHTAKSLVAECDPGMLSNQGTAIGPAINEAVKAFSDKKGVGKAIILFTDGENHESDAIEAAKEAAAKGIKIYAVTTGSASGAPIPVENGYLKDEEGKTVLSKANSEVTVKITEAGKGLSFSGSNISTLSRHIVRELHKLPQDVMGSNVDEQEELYGWFVAVACIILVLMQFILFRKNKIFSRINLFDRK